MEFILVIFLGGLVMTTYGVARHFHQIDFNKETVDPRGTMYISIGSTMCLFTLGVYCIVHNYM